MKVTDELLMVARAVRDRQWLRNYQLYEADLAALIAALPEAAPLPAPTGPGWWWARAKWGQQTKWMIALVKNNGGALLATIDGDPIQIHPELFDAWVGPLAEPQLDGATNG